MPQVPQSNISKIDSNAIEANRIEQERLSLEIESESKIKRERLLLEEKDENLETLTADQLSRRDVRAMIFHLLYAMESFDYQESLEAIFDNFNRGFNMDLKQTDEVFVSAQAILEKQDIIDETFKPLLDNWHIDRIGVPTKLILRLAVWELLETDMDRRIVINEAVELAKCFAEKDSFKFINGILDKITK